MKCELKIIGKDSIREGGHEGWAAASWLPISLACYAAAEGTQVTLFVKPRATLAMLPILAVLLYAGTAGGLAWWVSRQPHNLIRLEDFMLPWRWKTLRDTRGRMFCAQGVEALERGRPEQGIYLIRRGLAAHPDEATARLALARYFGKHHYYEGIRGVVLPQLAYASVPRELLEILFNEAARADDALTVAECADRLARRQIWNGMDRVWLQLRHAAALNALRRFDDALAVLAEPELRANSEAVELRVEALCGVGRSAEALAAATGIAGEGAGPAQRRLRLQASAHRSAGRGPELARTLAELIAQDPTAMESRLFVIRQLWSAGRAEEARRELDALLRRTSTRPGAILWIAGQLATAEAPELIAKCVEEARALGHPLDTLQSLLTLSYVSVANWTGAEEMYASLFGGGRKLAGTELYSREALRAVIDAGAGERPFAVQALRAVLERHRFVFSTYAVTAAGLARAQRWEALQLLAEAGLRHFPHSVELERRAGEARTRRGAGRIGE